MSDDTKERIILATSSLFAVRGYAAVSMRDIALATGLSKPGLYHHFVSKEDLLLAVLEHGLESLRPGIEALADESVPWKTRFLHWVEGILSLPAEKTAIVRIGRDVAALDKERRESFAVRYRNRFIEPIRTFLSQNPALISAAHGTSADKNLLAGLGVWIVLGALSAFLGGEGGAKDPRLDAAGMSNGIVSILMHGLAGA